MGDEKALQKLFACEGSIFFSVLRNWCLFRLPMAKKTDSIGFIEFVTLVTAAINYAASEDMPAGAGQHAVVSDSRDFTPIQVHVNHFGHQLFY